MYVFIIIFYRLLNLKAIIEQLFYSVPIKYLTSQIEANVELLSLFKYI